MFNGVSGQLAPRKIASQLGFLFGLGLSLILGLGAMFLWGNRPRTGYWIRDVFEK